MLPDLPKFAPKQVYSLSGRYLALLIDRIVRQTPLEGANIRLEETASGIILHADPQLDGTDGSILYDFAATWASAGVVAVAGGNVLAVDWGTPTPTDPQPVDWLDETNVAADTMAVADGESVWLHINLAEAEALLDGPLTATGAALKSVSAGGGGGGADGGGGGGGGLDSTIGGDGAAGFDAVGAVPGAEGDGVANGGLAPSEGSGTAAYGSAGGAGGAGGAGEVRSFTHYSRYLLSQKRWSVYTASFDVSASKPTSSAANIYIRIASVAGSIITQHHAGQVILTLPTATYISPNAS